jgi:tetratricopeptide (TPR) repeat protein
MSKPKPELINLLLITYRSQDKLDEAQSHLMDSVRSDASNIGPLSELLSLVEALFEKEDYPNALICGRRALRAYRKTGPVRAAWKETTLQLLVRGCQANGSHAD